MHLNEEIYTVTVDLTFLPIPISLPSNHIHMYFCARIHTSYFRVKSCIVSFCTQFQLITRQYKCNTHIAVEHFQPCRGSKDLSSFMYSHRNTTRSHSSLVHEREFRILSEKRSTRHLFTTRYSCICLVCSPFHSYIVIVLHCAASSEHITFITSNSSVVWIRRRFLKLFHQTAWLWPR